MTEVSEIVSVTLNRLTEWLIEIKLEFSIPAAVSKDPLIKDSVSIQFDQLIFFDQRSDFEINGGKPIIVELPRQVDEDKEEATQTVMESVKAVGSTIASFTSVGQILLKFSLKLLWGLINTLQFVVFFDDWQI